MVYKLTYENFLYLALGLISIFIIYKLFTANSSNLESGTEEGFQSIINKFKNSKSKGSKSNFSDIKKKSKTGRSKLSFDDIIKEAEDIDPGKYTVNSLKSSFFDYLESFQKAKFKNVTGTTDEALEKFGFFKDKFFEIFN
jgi:hypothetical protein